MADLVKISFLMAHFSPNREPNISDLRFEFAGSLVEKGAVGMYFLQNISHKLL